MIVSLVDVVLHLVCQCWRDFTATGFTLQMRSISVELSFQIDEDRTTRGEFLIGDGLLKLCVAFIHLRVERSGVEFLPGTANWSIKASSKLRRLSIVASLPVLVNVAVPQLAMKIATAKSKTLRDTSFEFIWRSFKLPILRRSGPTCQDSRTAASSDPNPVGL